MNDSGLPDRRAQDTIELVHDGQTYSVSFGYYSDGRLGEAFIQAHKVASPIEAAARDAAILLSLALEYGALVDHLRAAVTRDADGRPSSVVGAVLDAMTT